MSKMSGFMILEVQTGLGFYEIEGPVVRFWPNGLSVREYTLNNCPAMILDDLLFVGAIKKRN
jgi:hypothetical protein